MQLIYAVTTALVLGLAAHAALPGRAESGVLLLPTVAAGACAAVWTALTWSRLPDGGAVMWLASLLAAVVAAVAVGVPLRRRRIRADRARLAAL